MSLTPVPTGNDVQVNIYTTDQQLYPSVTALSDGGFVVTWTSDGQDGSGTGIYGQHYTADGTAVGSEFRVNTYTTSSQLQSSVTALSDGGFLVTWNSSNQDGNSTGIYGQRYAANSTAVGGEFRANTYTASIQGFSSATALSDGGFVVTWSSFLQDGSSSGIYGQRFAANGAAVGSEFRANTHTTSEQQFSSVTGLSGGGFVVTWESLDQDGDNYGIYGQRYASDGTAIGGEFQVNSYTTSFQQSPSVAALSDGGFLVTWSSSFQDGSSSGIYGQRYSADGTAVGTEFRANTYTASHQIFSSVSALPDGGFVVTWTSNGQDGDSYGIYGQRYAADGTAVGTEYRANQVTAGMQIAQTFYGSETVAALGDGRLVQVWAGQGAEEVFFRLLDVPSPPVFTSGSANSVAENAPTSVVVYDANATDEDPVTYSLSSGGDNDLFAIDAITGEVRFKASPDFEAPGDADGDNVYDIVVHASDGSLEATKAVAITVRDVDSSTGLTPIPLGNDVQVNTYTASNQTWPSVAALSDGGFVVTWSSFLQDGSNYGIYGQRYASDGTAIGAEFRANSYTTSDQFYSSVTALSDGGFVVTWSSFPQDGSSSGIYGQRYASDGTAVGSEFRANSYTPSNQLYSSVAALSDGGFVVTWSSNGQDGSGYGIYGQRYAPDGTAIGDEFRLNQITAGNQVAETLWGSETVAALGDGRLVQVWSGNGSEEVFFRLLDVSWGDNGLPVITSNAGGDTAAVSVAEGTTSVTTVTVEDPDAEQTLTYSLAGGADEAAFTIDGTSGVLSFVAAPDFETPADLDQDNIYEVVVEVSDGAGGIDSQAISVTVADVNTAPTITSGTTGTVAENAAIATVVYDGEANDDGEDSGTLTYALAAGGDNDLFAIDAGTGEVTFLASPDYETPADADGDNVYEITVEVSDGALSDTQAVSITVTDQNDTAPVDRTGAAQ